MVILTLNFESCIEIKIKLKFLFSHFFVVPQKAPQRNAKIKILT